MSNTFSHNLKLVFLSCINNLGETAEAVARARAVNPADILQERV